MAIDMTSFFIGAGSFAMVAVTLSLAVRLAEAHAKLLINQCVNTEEDE